MRSLVIVFPTLRYVGKIEAKENGCIVNIQTDISMFSKLCNYTYRGVDKSLARPGRKQANVSVRMA